jgi:butyrate kinase
VNRRNVVKGWRAIKARNTLTTLRRNDEAQIYNHNSLLLALLATTNAQQSNIPKYVVDDIAAWIKGKQ